MLDEIKTYEFLSRVGLETICAVIITLILTMVYKLILIKIKKINEMDATRKDIILSRGGRIIGSIVYISVYLVNLIVIKKETIVFDIKLITSLISGIVSTLIISKGVYTSIRQMEKKNSIYEKYEVAENMIKELENNNVMILGKVKEDENSK